MLDIEIQLVNGLLSLFVFPFVFAHAFFHFVLMKVKFFHILKGNYSAFLQVSFGSKQIEVLLAPLRFSASLLQNNMKYELSFSIFYTGDGHKQNLDTQAWRAKLACSQETLLLQRSTFLSHTELIFK